MCAAGKLLMALSLKLPPVARPKEKLKFDGLGTGIAAALCDVRTRAQADAMRLIFGLLGALMALCLAGTRPLVNTAAPRRRV